MSTYYIYHPHDTVSGDGYDSSGVLDEMASGYYDNFILKRYPSTELSSRGWYEEIISGDDDLYTFYNANFNDSNSNVSGPITSSNEKYLKIYWQGATYAFVLRDTTGFSYTQDEKISDKEEIDIPGLDLKLSHPIRQDDLVYGYSFNFMYDKILSDGFDYSSGNWTFTNASTLAADPDDGSITNVAQINTNTAGAGHSIIETQSLYTHNSNYSYLLRFRLRADSANDVASSAELTVSVVDGSSTETVVMSGKPIDYDSNDYRYMSIMIPGSALPSGEDDYKIKLDFDIDYDTSDASAALYLDGFQDYVIYNGTTGSTDSIYPFDLFEMDDGDSGYDLDLANKRFQFSIDGNGTVLDPSLSGPISSVFSEPGNVTYRLKFMVDSSTYAGTTDELIAGYGNTSGDRLLIYYAGSTNTISVDLNGTDILHAVIAEDIMNDVYVIVDSSSGTKLYVNSTEEANSATAPSIATGKPSTLLGGSNGIMFYETALWKRALTSAEFKSYTADIDLTHTSQNITDSNTVHGITQGTGNGFDADKVDGYNIDSSAGADGDYVLINKTSSKLEVLPYPTSINVVYVAKYGNDSNTGNDTYRPKLTLSSAISTGKSLVYVLDDGSYDCPNTVQDYELYAPHATLNLSGTDFITVRNSLTVKRIYTSSAMSTEGVINFNNGITASDAINININRLDYDGGYSAVYVKSIDVDDVCLNINIGTIHLTGTNSEGVRFETVADPNTTEGNVHVSNIILDANGATGVYIDNYNTTASAVIDLYVNNIQKSSTATTTIGVHVGATTYPPEKMNFMINNIDADTAIDIDGGTVNAIVNSIESTTLCDVASGATLNLYVNSQSGSESGSGTINISGPTVASGASEDQAKAYGLIY